MNPTSKTELAVKTGRFILRTLKELVVSLLLAIVISLFIKVYVVEATQVFQHSMEPNLYEHEQVFIEKVTYRFLHGPRRGDIVVLRIPGEEIPLIKRVVALPGEEVAVQNGQVFIDGQPLQETWTDEKGGRDYPPTRVPPLHVFVLGDNRDYSRDSRVFGPVPIDQIIGRAWFVFWPPDRFGKLH